MAQEMDNSDRSFLGRGWCFPPRFSRTAGGVEMSAEEADIVESLTILMSTRKGERFLEPKYGCNLDELLFEPASETLIAYVKGLIEYAILQYEPRVDLNELAIATPAGAEGRIDIAIGYTVRSTNARYNMVYPFYTDEGAGR